MGNRREDPAQRRTGVGRTQDLWPEAVSPRHQHIPEKPDSLEGQKVFQAGDVDMMRLRLKVSTFTKRFAFRGPEPIYG